MIINEEIMKMRNLIHKHEIKDNYFQLLARCDVRRNLHKSESVTNLYNAKLIQDPIPSSDRRVSNLIHVFQQKPAKDFGDFFQNEFGDIIDPKPKKLSETQVENEDKNPVQPENNHSQSSNLLDLFQCISTHITQLLENMSMDLRTKLRKENCSSVVMNLENARNVLVNVNSNFTFDNVTLGDQIRHVELRELEQAKVAIDRFIKRMDEIIQKQQCIKRRQLRILEEAKCLRAQVNSVLDLVKELIGANIVKSEMNQQFEDSPKPEDSGKDEILQNYQFIVSYKKSGICFFIFFCRIPQMT